MRSEKCNPSILAINLTTTQWEELLGLTHGENLQFKTYQ